MKKLMIAGMAVLMMACKGENQAFHFDEMRVKTKHFTLMR